ncbi:Uncharacterised protein [Klebsiella pneumoniae]|uniref:Uncharacterized protein n=1 Tax=Klebsiella pneumoniae TaxID=573 RepID=A0A2X3CAG9_KLEPN|nr:Uncharacterised protein [Klebsiella pneumoniae]
MVPLKELGECLVTVGTGIIFPAIIHGYVAHWRASRNSSDVL